MNSSALISRLRTFRAPGLVGLVLFGSAARAWNNAARNLDACRDIDLLIVVEDAGPEVAESLANWLEDMPRPLDIFVIAKRDFDARLVIGDAQLISILAEGLVIHGPGLRAWKRRADRAELRSDVTQVQRLLAEADRIASHPAARGREIRASLLAACQAILITLGVQPRGTRDLPAIVEALASQGYAPPGLAVLWTGVGDNKSNAEAARAWIAGSCIHAFQNLARSHWPSNLDLPAGPPRAVLIDLGGVLFAGGDAQPCEHAIEVLSDFARRFILVAVSNAGTSARELLQTHRMAQYFQDVVLSGEAGGFKPEPRIFELALQRAGVAAGDAVMVGDSLDADVCGAWRCGIRAIWLRSGTPAAAWAGSCGAIVANLAALARSPVLGAGRRERVG